MLLAVVLLLVAACGSDSALTTAAPVATSSAPRGEGFDGAATGAEAFEGDVDRETSAGIAAGDDDDASAAEEAPSVARSDTSTALGPRQVADAGRLLRREASISLEVDDLTASIDAAVAETANAGGYLSSEQTDRFFSQVVLRVPSDRFDQTLERLGNLGKIESQSVTTDDRTDVIVDLEARLITARASLERTRTFFDEAGNVEELTLLERELADRETLVAGLQAALDNERSSVALSTITVSFSLDRDDLPDELIDEDEPLPGILDALNNGWGVLVTLVYVIGLVLAWVAPWLLLAVPAGFLLRRLLLRRLVMRRARTTAATSVERMSTPAPSATAQTSPTRPTATPPPAPRVQATEPTSDEESH